MSPAFLRGVLMWVSQGGVPVASLGLQKAGLPLSPIAHNTKMSSRS